MPRFKVPRSTRTMYGTVTPAVVVGVARSAGVVPGGYGLKQLLGGAGKRVGGEGAGDVMAVERQAHRVRRDALRHANLEQRVAPAYEVRSVRQRHDLEIGRALSRLRGDQKQRAERQE